MRSRSHGRSSSSAGRTVQGWQDEFKAVTGRTSEAGGSSCLMVDDGEIRDSGISRWHGRMDDVLIRCYDEAQFRKENEDLHD